MADRFTDPLLTPAEVSRHLGIPRSTLYYWLNERAGGAPLVHRVRPVRRGWPSIPFAGLVEAYVLRSLRDLGMSKSRVREAAGEVRQRFGTPFALSSSRIATDGTSIFIRYAETDLARAGDHQRPFPHDVSDHFRYISWAADGFANRLRLRQYPVDVVIDPDFGFGRPVVEANLVPVDAVIGLWLAGEPAERIAEEHQLPSHQIEAICRVAAA
jgi:uncharacterized protein (DUF433 family)